MTNSNSKSKSDIVTSSILENAFSHTRKTFSNKFATPYNNPPPFVALKITKPSRTSQEFLKDCDVNTIIAAQSRGMNVHAKYDPDQKLYADFSNMPDLQTAQGLITRANEAFLQLPAAIRKRFGNDPTEFVSAFQDETRKDELVNLGLLKAPDPQPSPDASKGKKPTPPSPENKSADADASEGK